MADPLFTAGGSGMNARFGLENAIQRGDEGAVKRVFKTMEKGSTIGRGLMAVISVCVAVSMFVMAANTAKTAARETPTFPAEPGPAPITRLVDKTGFIAPYHLEEIPQDLERIAEEYHIQAAVYSSSEPVHEVYDEFFTGENGVVLYIEEHEKCGSVTYYYGDELSDIFTEENIVILNEAQTYLDGFTHDRAPNVVFDFKHGLDNVFRGADSAVNRMPFEVMTGVFWLVMAVVFFFLTRLFCFLAVGLPPRRVQREEYLKRILESIQLAKMRL